MIGSARYGVSLLMAVLVLGANQSIAGGADAAQVRGLLLQAIDAEDGKAQAWLSGEIAQKLKQQINAPAGTRVQAAVSTVSQIRPGCKRLALSLSTPTFAMATVKGTKEPFQVTYSMDLCRDGKPPMLSTVGAGGF